MCDKLNLAAPAAIFLVFIGPKHPKIVPKRSFLLHISKKSTTFAPENVLAFRNLVNSW